MDSTVGPIDVGEQGVVLAQARSHAFDVYPREEYVAPGKILYFTYCILRLLISLYSSADAVDAIFPAAGSPNVRLCLSYPITGSAPLRLTQGPAHDCHVDRDE